MGQMPGKLRSLRDNLYRLSIGIADICFSSLVRIANTRQYDPLPVVQSFFCYRMIDKVIQPLTKRGKLY
ncbi:hypothetical protein WS95_23460 [Burkholderia sp. MSMB1826]|uniref:Uncharacterized protein n=1 Tax=Burkholderia pseudomultivorans TaxID=1207504 RepID=A0A6P2H5I0_9BURK|nr:hypothetical protein WS95_23460 [Burkholderia sp. MSMB1826]VWB12358.1 hypothetical protein BPS26883_00416 [Burkholderia pseudomultivorans]